MKKILILVLIIPVILSGCWDEKKYERVGFILSVGIELSEDNKLLMSYTLPVVDRISKEKVEVIYAASNQLRGFREEAFKISPLLVEGGKIQQILISNSMAKHGMHNLLELFERDASLPLIANVIIVDGSPKELFKEGLTFKDKPRIAFYIYQLIDNNISKSYIPKTEIYKYNSLYFAPGIDPIAPMIKLEHNKGEGVEVTGSALFSDDIMVGKIDTKQTSLLLAMMGEMKKTVYLSDSLSPKNEQDIKSGAAIALNKPKRNLSVQILDGKPKVNLDLSFQGVLQEYKWDSITDSETKKTIEDTLSKEIKKDCINILDYTKEVGSDPLGIGNIIRAEQNSYWEKIDWKNDYKNVEFQVNVKVTIVNHGGIY